MDRIRDRTADADADREARAAGRGGIGDRDVDHPERHAGHDAERQARERRDRKLDHQVMVPSSLSAQPWMSIFFVHVLPFGLTALTL